MGKTLFISEKPKVTKSFLQHHLFRGSKFTQGSKPYYGYYENDKYIHTWARGHLMEVLNPGDRDPALKDFSFENLPLIFPLEHKVIEETKEQYKIIQKLINRTDVEIIVNACDIDREGALIFDEIYETSKSTKTVKRVLASSYEESDLEIALANIEDGHKFKSLSDSGKARQYLDHLLGDTITRASTVKLANKNFLLSGGRVQLCLLYEIRKRELEVESFIPTTFYRLFIHTPFSSEFVTDEQCIDPKPLIELGEALKGQIITVNDFVDKPSKKNPPNLYNLTDLYKDCHSKLSISPTKSKALIQNLYENGYLTYPRTDSRFLPTSMVEAVKNTVATLQNHSEYQEFSKTILIDKITEKKKVFNDKLVTAHFAIIPTKKVLPKDHKSSEEKLVYELVMKRFLASFMDPAVYQVREVLLEDQDENLFKSTEKVLIEPGFLSLFTEESNSEDDSREKQVVAFTIPELAAGDTITVESTELKKGQTKKPSLYTETSILTFMETAGRKLDEDHLKELMKGKRIGTSATAESFVPKLIERNYIVNEKNKLTTTSLGSTFIDAFPVIEIKDPTFTAELEYKVQQIQDEKLSYDDFILETNLLAEKIVEEFRNLPTDLQFQLEKINNQELEVCKCSCGKGIIIDKGKFFSCNQFPECKNCFPKVLLDKKIPVAQVKKFFENGETDVISGFKKDDKVFDRAIRFEDGKFKFFTPTLGTCPKCQKGNISLKNSFYGCSEYANGCSFTVSQTILKKKLPEGQVKKLLKQSSTDFMEFEKDDKMFQGRLAIENGEVKLLGVTKEDRTLGKCPLCSANVLIGKQYYLCENYKNPCDFILPFTFLGKSLVSGQIKKLLSIKVTDKIKGFKPKDATKKPFDAKLTYDRTEKRLKFVFK